MATPTRSAEGTPGVASGDGGGTALLPAPVALRPARQRQEFLCFYTQPAGEGALQQTRYCRIEVEGLHAGAALDQALGWFLDYYEGRLLTSTLGAALYGGHGSVTFLSWVCGDCVLVLVSARSVAARLMQQVARFDGVVLPLPDQLSQMPEGEVQR